MKENVQMAKMKTNKSQKAKMTIFGGNFLAESVYLNLPFWRGPGSKSGPVAFLKTQGKEMKAQKAKMKGNEGPKGKNERK